MIEPEMIDLEIHLGHKEVEDKTCQHPVVWAAVAVVVEAVVVVAVAVAEEAEVVTISLEIHMV
jgi:hypothetical protein